MSAATMFDAATMLGDVVRTVINRHSGEQLAQSAVDFSCNFLVGGQISGEPPRLFMVYPEGNFIESTPDTPYFQIGESKYGKPILDRVIRPSTSINQAIKCALVSFDSTIKSNLSVGLPIDVAVLRRDALRIGMRHRIDAGDAYFGSLRESWSEGLRRVFNELPAPEWVEKA